MKIITWNINGIRARLKTLAKAVEMLSPDIICLQEIKVMTDLFPTDAIAAMGYTHQVVAGMRAFNGVAILSKKPLQNTGQMDWCGKNDARHVFALLPGNIELHNVYVPAGGDIPDSKVNDKFDHKLKFLRAMTRWAQARQEADARRILVGDLNIAPLAEDVWSTRQLRNTVSHTAIERENLLALVEQGGWTDSVRAHFGPKEVLFSWWSYRARDWVASNRGRRLDHIWVSRDLASKVEAVTIESSMRGAEKPSDHVPIIVDIDI